MAVKGHLFDIQSFSVHDGPGCRTSVFLTGCPLQCAWCANPESWVVSKHLMYAENLCKWDKGCRACRDACPSGSIRFDGDGRHRLTRETCLDCRTFDCVASCPNSVLKQCVKDYTVDELVSILRRDFNNWGPDGGVTFTGGDPLVQHGFLLEVLERCRVLQIHTAIETSACVSRDIFLGVMPYVDFAFIDVKHMDRDRHREGTGVANDLILSNIAALRASDWGGRLVLRQPTIGGFNDDEANALQVIDFMNTHGLYEINLLTFHPLGETKWNQLGKDYAYTSGRGNVAPGALERLQQLYLKHNIACYIGENTPF
ncbi:4-hydroxyphenylacetate decarboxylase activase [Holophaga foetida]|uniref:4-hydroxyphenylacetate decarboxylase activase n=1 Tax=Holophaga foetida TaxID=35839 RepID=UPI0002472F0B|nr:4-hydroxyphenylacetate decarboxylase activase [Holophaga foetida]